MKKTIPIVETDIYACLHEQKYTPFYSALEKHLKLGDEFKLKENYKGIYIQQKNFPRKIKVELKTYTDLYEIYNEYLSAARVIIARLSPPLRKESIPFQYIRIMSDCFRRVEDVAPFSFEVEILGMKYDGNNSSKKK